MAEENETQIPGSGAPSKAELVGETGQASGLDFVMDVPLRLSVEVGHAKLLVREVLQFSKGSVVELDRMSGEPADIIVNGRMVARGELIVVDDRLAIRVVEVTESGDALASEKEG